MFSQNSYCDGKSGSSNQDNVGNVKAIEARTITLHNYNIHFHVYVGIFTYQGLMLFNRKMGLCLQRILNACEL